MLTRVWGQPSIGCFVEGKCTQSLYLEEHSTPGGELECLEYCTTVEGSNYFSYDPDTTVSMVDHFFGKSLLMRPILIYSIVCAGKIVKPSVFHGAAIASLVMSVVFQKSVL